MLSGELRELVECSAIDIVVESVGDVTTAPSMLTASDETADGDGEGCTLVLSTTDSDLTNVTLGDVSEGAVLAAADCD